MDSAGNIFVADLGNNRIQKFDSSGYYLTQWGTTGSGDGQFNLPRDVAVDSSGNVYVVEFSNHRVQKIDNSGNYLLQWGTNGSADGQFNSPSGMAVDAADHIYIADTLNHRIQKFDSNGNYFAQWGSNGSGDGQFNTPRNVTVDAVGNVYVTDTENDRIQKFDGAGNYLAQWGSTGSAAGQMDAPEGVVVDAAGNVYIADYWNNRIQKFSADVFTLDDAVPDDSDGITDMITFPNLLAGSYAIAEILPDGWSLDSISCDSGNWTPNLSTQTLSITLVNEDNVTCTFTNSAITSGVIYVDDTATGANNGTSWADAYTDPQNALAVAAPGAEILVAAGLYLPGTDKTDTFRLKNGVTIYGSFPDGGGEPEERSFANYTVLSGDLAGDDLASSSGIVTDTANIVGDNSYHIVTANDVDHTAILDGFYITAGQADNSTWPDDSGGGMFANGSPFLQNIRFVGNYATAEGGGVQLFTGSAPILRWVYFNNNYADESGGGMLNENSNPILISTAFTFNSAKYDGGGMTNINSNPQMLNSIFDGNAAIGGAGMDNYGSDPVLVNVNFIENRASSVGGALYNRNDSQVDVLNSIFWQNSPDQSYHEDTSTSNFADSLIQNGCPLGSICTGTILTSDPLFVRNPGPGSDGIWGTSDDDFGDLHLTEDSPAIDVGNNSNLPSDDTDLDGDGNTTEPIPYDFDFNSRVINETVDMGAYERMTPSLSIFLPIVVR